MSSRNSPSPVRWVDLAAIGAVLLVLLALSALTALGRPAAWKAPASLGIAVLKTAIIAWFFMQLRTERGLVRLFAAAGLLCLSIGAVLAAADYLTR